jgi:hypothetical protein
MPTDILDITPPTCYEWKSRLDSGRVAGKFRQSSGLFGVGMNFVGMARKVCSAIGLRHEPKARVAAAAFARMQLVTHYGDVETVNASDPYVGQSSRSMGAIRIEPAFDCDGTECHQPMFKADGGLNEIAPHHHLVEVWSGCRFAIWEFAAPEVKLD